MLHIVTKVLYPLSLLLSTILLSGCSFPSCDDDGRLELPMICDGEVVITYSGYSDISYGGPVLSDETKVGYTVSFDENLRLPRWVAYDLSSEELKGGASRNGKSFRPDFGFPLKQAENDDYRNSGWTRGHLAPAGDFKWSDTALNDTFLFTNCCPQTEYFNATSWESLEAKVRNLARKFGRIYVVTGPLMGETSNGHIGRNRIPIPDAFFKALLVRSGSSFHSVGFIMHNISEPQPYTSCAVTVDEIERLTGLDLFHSLEDPIEERIEASFDRKFWGL